MTKINLRGSRYIPCNIIITIKYLIYILPVHSYKPYSLKIFQLIYIYITLSITFFICCKLMNFDVKFSPREVSLIYCSTS